MVNSTIKRYFVAYAFLNRPLFGKVMTGDETAEHGLMTLLEILLVIQPILDRASLIYHKGGQPVCT